ncbi:WG repeat-containing protein [Chryseobacterium sp. c4a]|uniref:WG repeat-containing protein n=1 Tax=Chryseobacterium sp. c4a TaxID=1573582 RepID=UPI0013595AC7|nr:WG repeat-containing protein [Chryseobacterium sp. c4a]
MRISREDLEKNRGSKESEFLLSVDFEQYLSDRSFYANLDKDFSGKNFFPLIPLNPEHEWYYFNVNDQEFEVGKWSSEGYDSRFRRIYLTDTKSIYPWKYKTCYGICSEENSNILIFPYFDSIWFYSLFNVFVCKNSFKDTVNSESLLGQVYYFDTKGRFIRQEKESYFNLFPNVAVIDNEIKEIKLDNINVCEVYRYNLFVASITDPDNRARKQVVDNNGNFILDKAYLDVVVRPAEETIFAVDKNEIICFDTKGNKKKTYTGFNRIDEVGESCIRVGYESIDEEAGFILINFDGEQPLKQTYDFIEKCSMSQNYKFFQGDWYNLAGAEKEDPEIEIVQAKLDKIRSDIMVYSFHPNGKWGIINENEEILIPCIYDWIEELSENIFLLNEGGRLLRCSRCIDEWDGDSVDELIVHGGRWFTYSFLDAKLEPAEIEYDSNNFINSVYKIE